MHELQATLRYMIALGVCLIAVASAALVFDHRSPERALWLAVLAPAVVGSVVAGVSYHSMHVARSTRMRIRSGSVSALAPFDVLLELAGEAIVTADDSGTIVHFNRSAESIFGRDATHAVGRSLDDLLPSAFATIASAAERRVSTATYFDRLPNRFELSGRRASGDVLVVEGAASRMQMGDRQLITAVLRDVTEYRARDRREHLLAETATRLSPRLAYGEQLSAVAQLAMAEIGDWAILDVLEEPDSGEIGEEGAPRMLRVTSSPRDSRLESDLWELEAAPARWTGQDPAMEALRTGKHLYVPSVSTAWIDERYGDESARQLLRRLAPRSLIVVPLVVDARAIGALTIGIGGERTATEEDLVLAQLLADRAASAIEVTRLFRRVQRSTAARDAVLSVVSHDLVGALGVVTMNARRLRDDADERHRHLCENILGSAEMMHRLTLDLVDFSAIEMRRLAVAPVRHALGDVVASARGLFDPRAAAANVHLDWADMGSLPEVQLDPPRILQVLSNILDNALKFTPAGGRIEVAARVERQEVVVSVRDTGAGVSPDELPHVFERFWRANAMRGTRGQGLGLAIVRGVVLAHGGRVWMDSAIGRGSTVCFTLPVADPPRTPPADVPA